MKLLVISCSHHPQSRSSLLAEQAYADLAAAGADGEWLDLAQLRLPFCDGASSYGHNEVILLAEKIAAAQGIILATPIYNYDVNAAAKNLLELTGRNWMGKVIGFLCAAGGQGSYMSIMPFANSLMLDFRCVIVPRFVYATGVDFSEDAIRSPHVRERVRALAQDVLNFSRGLEGLTAPGES